MTAVRDLTLQRAGTAPPIALRPTRVKLEPFVIGLQKPSHMEWTADRRLLVSEHRAGQIKDITEGGDARQMRPFASGLRGPAALLPLGDRVLATEFFGGRVSDVARGGDVSKNEPFATGLNLPYNIVATRQDGDVRIIVSEDVSLGVTRYTDITRGGDPKQFTSFIGEIPGRPHYQKPRQIDVKAVADMRSDFYETVIGGDKCGNWGIAAPLKGGKQLVLSVSSLGMIVRVPEGGGRFMSFLDDPANVLAWGLAPMGGMKEHPTNGLIYVSQPDRGAVMAVDPEDPHNYVSDATVLELPRPGFPRCIRFSEDGDSMYVCDGGNGIVWRVTDFLH